MTAWWISLRKSGVILISFHFSYIPYSSAQFREYPLFQFLIRSQCKISSRYFHFIDFLALEYWSNSQLFYVSFKSFAFLRFHPFTQINRLFYILINLEKMIQKVCSIYPIFIFYFSLRKINYILFQCVPLPKANSSNRRRGFSVNVWKSLKKDGLGLFKQALDVTDAKPVILRNVQRFV